MNRLKKNDEVVIIAGRSKGSRGVVRDLLGDRVIVTGVNMVSKHMKPNPNAGVEGGIIKKEAPIHASNVAILNKDTDKADRIGYRTEEVDGKQRKVRYFKSNNKKLD